MKKFFISLLLVFSFFFGYSLKSFALSGNGFIWNKTEINVLINSSFESYLSEFHVEYYYDGVILDKDVKVELDSFYYGGQTISTSTVCDKDVCLLAYVPGYSNYDKKMVKVHIIDNIKPTITLIKQLKIDVGTEFHPEDYFLIKDNDKIDQNSIKFEYDKRQLEIIGKHEITVYAKDVSNNVIQRTFTFVVEDKSMPLLNIASNIEIEYGNQNFDIRDFVEAYDDFDGYITDSVKCEGLDIFKLGEQTITISVTDANGNTAKIEKTVNVVDFSAPILELKTYEDNIDINECDDINLISYISKIKDNVDDLTIDDVIIDTSDFYKKIGRNLIYYTLFDKTGNYIKRTLQINIINKDKPVIEASDLTFKKGESFNLKEYIKVSSSFDPNVINTYTIDDKVLNKNEAGTYEVIIEAMDYLGNQSSKSIYVTIEDDTNVNKDKLSEFYNILYEHKLLIIIAIIITFVIIIINKNKKEKKLGL